jgi:hypothetical protein
VKATSQPALTVVALGSLVTLGGASVVSVAALLAVKPTVLVKTTRKYSSPPVVGAVKL